MSRAPEKPENWLYGPLPPGNLIRCLILQPGLEDEPLEGRLNIVNLDDCPQYEAISYVWGSTVRSQTFVCDGNLTHITVSLSMALRRFRYTEKPRVLWADSICINQGDLSEKGHQVALMGQVYSKASKVLIHIAGDDQGLAPQVGSLVSETNNYVSKSSDSWTTSGDQVQTRSQCVYLAASCGVSLHGTCQDHALSASGYGGCHATYYLPALLSASRSLY